MILDLKIGCTVKCISGLVGVVVQIRDMTVRLKINQKMRNKSRIVPVKIRNILEVLSQKELPLEEDKVETEKSVKMVKRIKYRLRRRRKVTESYWIVPEHMRPKDEVFTGRKRINFNCDV